MVPLPALEWEDCWTEDTPLRYNVLVYPQYLRNPAEAFRANTRRATRRVLDRRRAKRLTAC